MAFAVIVLQIKRHDAKLRAVPRTAIDKLVVGARVRVVGKAVGTDIVSSPYTGTSCLAFSCERIDKTKRSPLEPREPARVEDIRPFVVDDGTGTIAFDIGAATLDLASSQVPWEVVSIIASESAHPANALARERLEQARKKRPTGFVTSYYEGVIVPDAPVAVIGVVVKADDGTLRLEGSHKKPLVISNDSAAL